MEEIELKAETREKLGSGEARRIRRNGFIPAVLYGKNEKPLHLKVSLMNLHKTISAGENIIIKLKVDSGAKSVMIKEVQYDPVEDGIVHVDFYQVSMRQEVEVKVPIDVAGEPKGVREKGGVLEQILRELEVKCLPGDIPPNIVVDVSALDIGDTISASQLKIPEKVEMITPPDSLVVGVIAPTKLEEEKPPEEEEITEPELIGKEKKVEEEEGEKAAEEKEKEEGAEEEKGEKSEKEKGKEKGKEKERGK